MAKKPTKSKKKKTLEHQLILRNLKASDYDGVAAIMKKVYPDMGPWQKRQFTSQINRFPEGQICIEDKGQVVGAALSLIVDYEKFGDDHTYEQITGNGYLTTHDPSGDTLYGLDMFVDPTYRDMRLGRRLYDARKELCENLNLRRMLVGGRIPGYNKYAKSITPQRYIDRVRQKEIRDPILSFQLANDFHVRRLVKDYSPQDVQSHTYAVLLEWNNIYYEPKPLLIGTQKSVVRVGALQWQMRTMPKLDDLFDQMEYFVDVMANYNADFALFPEYFNAPLMAQFAEMSDADAIRALSGFTAQIRERFIKLAIDYNINIISGSMPEYRYHSLYNVSFLCRRDGTWDEQYKLHVTPDEIQYWGLKGGNKLNVFQTDVGKIAILICYDIEFPELSRLLAEQGVNIIFVPYWTDTKNAYLRVRRCAQARAIENECFVVISGSVGNIPKISNMDIQYSQSAVFSPSDFSFPHDATVAEATPNTEMTLMVDLDLELIKELRHQGSVRNLRDRRLDLYSIQWNDAE